VNNKLWTIHKLSM